MTSSQRMQLVVQKLEDCWEQCLACPQEHAGAFALEAVEVADEDLPSTGLPFAEELEVPKGLHLQSAALTTKLQTLGLLSSVHVIYDTIPKAAAVLRGVAANIGRETSADVASCLVSYSALHFLRGAATALHRLCHALTDGQLRPKDAAARGATAADLRDRLISLLLDPTLATAVSAVIRGVYRGITREGDRFFTVFSPLSYYLVSDGDGDTDINADAHSPTAEDAGASTLSRLDVYNMYYKILDAACTMLYMLVYSALYVCASKDTDAGVERSCAAVGWDLASAGLWPAAPPAAARFIDGLEQSALLDELSAVLLAVKVAQVHMTPPLQLTSTEERGGVSSRGGSSGWGEKEGGGRGTSGDARLLMRSIHHLASSTSGLVALVPRLSPPFRVGRGVKFRPTPLAIRVLELVLVPRVHRLQFCLLQRFLMDRLQPPSGGSVLEAPGRLCGWELLDELRLHEQLQVAFVEGLRTHMRLRHSGVEDVAVREVLAVRCLIDPALDTWLKTEQLDLSLKKEAGQKWIGTRAGNDSRVAGSSHGKGCSDAGADSRRTPDDVMMLAAKAVMAPEALLAALNSVMEVISRLRQGEGGPGGSLRPDKSFPMLNHHDQTIITTVIVLLEGLPNAQAQECLPAGLEVLARVLAAAADEGERLIAAGAELRAQKQWRGFIFSLLGKMIEMVYALGIHHMALPQRRLLALHLARARWYSTLNRLLRLLVSMPVKAPDRVLVRLMQVLRDQALPAALLGACGGGGGDGLSSAAAAAAAASSSSSHVGPFPDVLSVNRDLVDLLVSLTKVLSRLAFKLDDGHRQLDQMLEAVEPTIDTTGAGCRTISKIHSLKLALADMRVLGRMHDEVLLMASSYLDSVLEALGEFSSGNSMASNSNSHGRDDNSKSKNSAFSLAASLGRRPPPPHFQLQPPIAAAWPSRSAADAELRGAAAACMTAGCRAAAARLAALASESDARLPPQLRLRARSRPSRGSGGGGGLGGVDSDDPDPDTGPDLETQDLEELAMRIFLNMTVGAAWLAGPLLRWLPGRRDVDAVQLLRLLTAAKEWWTRSPVREKFVAARYSGAEIPDRRSYSLTSVAVSMVGALTSLAAHEGTCQAVWSLLHRELAVFEEEEDGTRIQTGIIQFISSALQSLRLHEETRLWRALLSLGGLRVVGDSPQQQPAGVITAFRDGARGLMAAWSGIGGSVVGGHQGLSGEGRDREGNTGTAVAAAARSVPSVVLPLMCGNPLCSNFRGAREGHLELQQCGGCRAVHYCGIECQREHWGPGRHKDECRRGWHGPESS